jgi:hypothetical protein
VPQDTCFRHKQKHAAYRCQQCSKPVCDRCTVNARFCSKACNKLYSKFVADYKAPARSGGLGGGQVFLALLVTAAVVGGLWYAKQQGMF